MKHNLPKLPYEFDALGPYISKETLEYHYGKHHQKYVDTLNELILGTPFEDMPLDDIVQNAAGAIFNNAAQTWNHNFYWNCLTPAQDSVNPSGELLSKINQDFGSFEKLKQKFEEDAETNFGSGWTWLIKKRDGCIAILNASNADNPLRLHMGAVPLLTCDVWEHAYYIDYRNERPKYLDAFWKIVNWNFVGENFKL